MSDAVRILNKTGCELYGEIDGVPYSQWSVRDGGVASFGQGATLVLTAMVPARSLQILNATDFDLDGTYSHRNETNRFRLGPRGVAPLSIVDPEVTKIVIERVIGDRGVLGAAPARADPIPMRLNCPACGALHVDEGEFATRPHHTHACQECGMTWRPAVVDTVGVRFLPGFKNGEKA